MTTIHAPRGVLRPPRRRNACALLLQATPLLALLASACDFPTSLPKWDTSWLVPSKSTTLTVAQLLPANVTLAGDNSAFLLGISPVNTSRSLGELCAACAALSGQTAPKPAFTAVLGDSVNLPSQVTGGTLASGTVSVAINNNLGFDPIRPAAAARGSMVVTLTSGGRTVGSLTLDGNTDALPNGQATTRAIQLTPGTLGTRIAMSVTVTSPLGDAVRIDANQRLSITATPQAIRLSDVSVTVSQKTVSVQPQTFDLSDIDQAIVDRVREPNALVLTVANPFGVTGTLNVSFQNAAMPITKQVPLQAGTTTQRVAFTRDEMRAILGRMVTLNATGTVNAASAVKLSPSQVVKVDTQIELTLGPKED